MGTCIYFCFILYISHQTRQPQTELWDISYQHEHNENRCEIYQKLSEHSLYLDISHLNTNKQCSAHRRRNGSDTEIEDQHDTKVDGVHAKCSTHWKENRGKDQAGRCHIHKSTYDQQDHIDQQEDDDLIAADGQQTVGYGCGNIGKCHNP